MVSLRCALKIIVSNNGRLLKEDGSKRKNVKYFENFFGFEKKIRWFLYKFCVNSKKLLTILERVTLAGCQIIKFRRFIWLVGLPLGENLSEKKIQITCLSLQ